MFVVNPYATPYFSVPTTGSNSVNDAGGFSLAGTGSPSAAFASHFWDSFSLNGSRAYNQNWVFNPVVAPNRLLLMQCAYQRVVGLTFDECSPCRDVELA